MVVVEESGFTGVEIGIGSDVCWCGVGSERGGLLILLSDDESGTVDDESKIRFEK